MRLPFGRQVRLFTAIFCIKGNIFAYEFNSCMMTRNLIWRFCNEEVSRCEHRCRRILWCVRPGSRPAGEGKALCATRPHAELDRLLLRCEYRVCLGTYRPCRNECQR